MLAAAFPTALSRPTCRVMVALFMLLGAAQNQAAQGDETRLPNILFIVADDLGYSDIGAFGARDIRTPNIDSLAAEGVRLSNFHTLPTCAPTRSVLLTGADNHQSGIGSQVLTEAQRGKPGYEGYLNERVVTLAEVLKDKGYRTYMSGKWHLGTELDRGPAARGFDESFALLPGGASHYADARPLHPAEPTVYNRNGKVVDSLPADFYSSRTYTELLLNWLQRDASQPSPFFAYLAYTAPHDPLQAPADYVARYKGAYDDGYEALRERRFDQLKAEGLIPADQPLPPWPKAVPHWNELSAEEQRASSRDMEIYAAMVDYMDEQIGRVLETLQQQGQLDNTLILFMSDNGANGAPSKIYETHTSDYHASFDNSLDNRGAPGSFVSMGAGWATASTAAFKLFKVFLNEGGIRTPAIVVPPGGLAQGRASSELVHVRDIVPSVLALVGAEHPAVHDSELAPLLGRALLPMLTEGSALPPAAPIGYELHGARAYVENGWKALNTPMPIGPGRWQLFDLNSDPAESADLAGDYPQRLAEMKAKQAKYERDNGVIYAPPSGIEAVQQSYRILLGAAPVLVVLAGLLALRRVRGRTLPVLWGGVMLALLVLAMTTGGSFWLVLAVLVTAAKTSYALLRRQGVLLALLGVLLMLDLALLWLLQSDIGLRAFLAEYPE